MHIYNKEFYEYVEKHSVQEAKIIIPYILEQFHPKSVVDFGCAEGIWLKTVRDMENHISILGLDGDYIDKDKLKIPEDCFHAADLSKPVQLQQKYDLAISLEVAEHIDEQYSDVFIENLVNASDYIVFSAAVPGQGGINHLNEQRQSYWVEKFAEREYLVDTSIRDYFWNEKKIAYYYRQNILCFIKKGVFLERERKKELYDVVHPELLTKFRTKVDDMSSQLYSMFSHPEYFERINYVCKEALKLYEKIIIYPFGIMGKICEGILKNAYQVQELIIADNKLCYVEPDIFSLDDINKLDNAFAIIECCNNPVFHSEVLWELEKKVKNKEIFKVF